MFLVLYPVDNDCGLERHSFKNYDLLDKKDAKEVLQKIFENGVYKLYDLDQTSRSSRYHNLADFVDDCNDEEIDMNTWWMVYLNLTEEEVFAMPDSL